MGSQTNRRLPQYKQTGSRETTPLFQKECPSCSHIAAGKGKNCHHSANDSNLWPTGTAHGRPDMIEGQLVLDLLLKWSGKGEMRGLWSDLSCVGTCLLHSGLDTPEFLHVGQQRTSSFLPHWGTSHRNVLERNYSRQFIFYPLSWQVD